ncbi:unannotated protein [freshwater metagenome]|uniref:Unannotated protein n=1 Tax=freshwater metagenome TaxID=449393 RepID=A0A6J6D060_9ZZZZ
MSLVPSATRANFAYAYASSTVTRPPTSTPAFLPFSPVTAVASASGHVASRKTPFSRIKGAAIRSLAIVYWNAQRPLSQFHSSFTSGSFPASRRRVLFRRTSVRIEHPDAQCSQTVGVETRSNGRDRNR